MKNRRIYGLVRRQALVTGLLVIFAGAGGFAVLDADWLRAAGPPIPGHERLACAACHQRADGTIRQQIQANVRYWLGLRESGTSFIHAPVASKSCQACHDRSDDRHPISRFRELRFAEARERQGVHACTGCHREHKGRRVTAAESVCQHCHSDTEVFNDTIEPTHDVLFATAQWTTCLRCHDFHGNHDGDVPTHLSGAPSLSLVRAYLDSGRRIHGAIRTPASEEVP